MYLVEPVVFPVSHIVHIYLFMEAAFDERTIRLIIDSIQEYSVLNQLKLIHFSETLTILFSIGFTPVSNMRKCLWHSFVSEKSFLRNVC